MLLSSQLSSGKISSPFARSSYFTGEGPLEPLNFEKEPRTARFNPALKPAGGDYFSSGEAFKEPVFCLEKVNFF